MVPIVARQPGELHGRGRLAGALEADQHHHCGRRARVAKAGRGLLSAQQPDRGDVVHGQRATALVEHHVVVEYRLGWPPLELLQRLEAHRPDRRLVGVDDVVVGIADGHGLGQGVEDLRQPRAAPAQRVGQLVEQLCPLGGVLDPHQIRAAGLGRAQPDGDRDRDLAPVAGPRGQLGAPDRRIGHLTGLEAAHPPARPLVVGFNQELAQIDASGPVGAAAEQLLGPRVHVGDTPVGVDTDKTVVRRLDDEPRVGAQLGQARRGVESDTVLAFAARLLPLP